MKISTRLPLALGLAFGLLLAGALFGIQRLNAAVSMFEHDVAHHVAGNKTSTEISVALGTAIQEWKNVLLRGKETQLLDKHWTAHEQSMATAERLVQTLASQVDERSPEHALVNRLRTELAGRRVLFAPTGALLSPTSSFQGESIPGICHAVVFSAGKEGET